MDSCGKACQNYIIRIENSKLQRRSYSQIMVYTLAARRIFLLLREYLHVCLVAGAHGCPPSSGLDSITIIQLYGVTHISHIYLCAICSKICVATHTALSACYCDSGKAPLIVGVCLATVYGSWCRPEEDVSYIYHDPVRLQLVCRPSHATRALCMPYMCLEQLIKGKLRPRRPAQLDNLRYYETSR